MVKDEWREGTAGKPFFGWATCPTVTAIVINDIMVDV